MSCGSKVCISFEPIQITEKVKRPWSLLRVWRFFADVIDKTRREQLRLELEKARQRGLLKHLDDRQLRDIGLTREQADREARKPFWK